MQIRASGLPAAAVLLGCTLGLAPGASALTIDWVAVGDPLNGCDLQTQGCFGSVAVDYRIAATETTNAQYAEFLNAVADEDAFGLYNPSMNSSSVGGIARSGSSGSFSYAAKAGRESMPVNFVSFWDALRFANWLNNDQPIGTQDASTTEGGAYTISQLGIDNNLIERNPTATIFLASENEWYKAAYYDAVSTSYFNYPAGSDVQTSCGAPGPALNTASCDGPEIDAIDADVDDLTAVGSFTGSASPAGTFDQGGNVWEWNEAIINASGRGLRGGSYLNGAGSLAASDWGGINPSLEQGFVGFRVAASIPEPETGPLPTLGVLILAGWRRWSREAT